jgi:hypothetical protein
MRGIGRVLTEQGETLVSWNGRGFYTGDLKSEFKAAKTLAIRKKKEAREKARAKAKKSKEKKSRLTHAERLARWKARREQLRQDRSVARKVKKSN